MEGYAAVTDPFEWNPRCARRDFIPTTEDYTFTNLYNMTLGEASQSVYTFQNELQGRFSDGFLGTHTAGHVKVGGDAADFFSSTNDPVFFLHHAMLDRVWWMW
jgi:tyrosinase